MTKWRRPAANAVVAAGCMAAGAAELSAANWYLRAGLGFDRAGKTVFADRECSSASTAALYGRGARRRRRSLSFGRAFRDDDSP